MLVEVLKDLREKIQSQVITQTLSSILKIDVKSVEKIVTDKDILLAPIPHIHPNPLPESRPYTSTIKTDPIYTCFLKLLDGVLSEWSNNGTSTFYLQAPTNYNFDVIIKAPEQTIITFSINGIEKEMEVGEVGQVIYKVDAALKTGQLYPVSVIIKNLPQNSKDKVSLYCQLPGKVVTPVPPNLLISSTTADTAMGALTRLSQLQKIVKFTADEMAYWGRTLRIDNRGWMNSIPTQPLENIEKKKALWQTISVLASYIKIKKEVNVSPELWIQILGNPEILAPNGKKLLGEITGWKETDINDVLSKLNLSWENLSNIDNLLKIKPALDLVNQTGLSAKDVIGFITGEVSLDDARSIVRQKIGDVAWREKAGVVTDPLRKMQRDALVQLILFKYRPPGSIDTPNKLYEHFLIDIEMDACMKTSRILQAISVVQLFVQRCFLNLEPNVDISPILLRREQWEWMKRYRVWEAGRKIFLYPENWLEPEFRDDKSYMFRDLESELLKTDINRELAETAYINYIQKLDNIARLEICGMYLEESESGNQYDDVLHVIARTTGTDWHYFYRRLCGTWSPWEKVDLTINSDQVLPVVLNGRLYLLWLSIMEKTEPLDDTLEVYKYAEKIIGEITKKYFEIKLNIAGYINYKWSVIKSDDGFCKVAFDDYKINSPKDIKLYIGRIVKENKIVFTILPFKEYVIGDISDKKALITSFDKINVHLPNMREINEIPAPFDHITSIWSYNQNRSNGNFRELEGKFIMYNSERHILKIVDGHMVKMMPIWHSIIFQQESPVCIMDDNAVFMVKPKEEIFPAIYEWHSYLDSWNMQNMNQEPFTLSSMSESLGYWENGKKQFKENSKITFEASDSEITNFKQLQIDQIFEYNGFSLDALGKRQLTQAFPDEIQTPKGTNKNINH